MNISIRSKNVELTSPIKEYIEAKIGKLQKYYDELADAEAQVLVSVKKEDQKIEVTIPLKQLFIRAEITSNNIYSSVDLVEEKLQRQLRKFRTKLYKKNRKIGLDEIPKMQAADAQVMEEEETLVIERTKSFDLTPMDDEEAVLQMNLLGHHFFLYLDDKSMRTSVVYKRSDGSYGKILSS